MYDFHTHTFLSDGVLSPVELIRRAYVQGYHCIAITDHVGVGNVEYVVKTLIDDCKMATRRLDILALPGVEITHVPKEEIDEVAHHCKSMGAKLVIVHGETIVEPVEPGTNLAALRSTAVDLLAHPGLLTPEEAALAKERGIFLEISARKGHSLTNGHVAKTASKHEAMLMLDSDAHGPDELLNAELCQKIAKGAGLSEKETNTLLNINPKRLLEKLGVCHPTKGLN